MIARVLTVLIALIALPVAAQAAGGVAISSKVFVEKTETGSDGRLRAVLREPDVVAPGDMLVFILGYRNDGAAAASNLVVTNPVPAAIAYRGAGDSTAQLSVDGGRSWGALDALTVKISDGRLRSARPEDVTHIRWALGKAVPAGAQGRLSFRGVVR